VEQLAHSEAELDATSTRVLGQMKKEVSQLTEETKKAQEVATTTRQVFDKIKTERSNAERTVKNKKELVDHSDNMIANNEISMDKDRQHRTELQDKLRKLESWNKLNDKISKKARVDQKHRSERLGIAVDEDDLTIPDMMRESSGQ
jgi:chromosome segregation ATPase